MSTGVRKSLPSAIGLPTIAFEIVAGFACGSVRDFAQCSLRCFTQVLSGQRFITLVQQRRWTLATTALMVHTCPVNLATMTDRYGDSALSWAAYKADKSDSCRRLFSLLLILAPEMSRARDRIYGFLPLHSAAWGGAPCWVPALLALAHPAALQARSTAKETAYDLLAQHGSRGPRPAWPSELELARRAASTLALSQFLFITQALCLPLTAVYAAAKSDKLSQRLGQALASRLQLPRVAAALVAKCLAPIDSRSLLAGGVRTAMLLQVQPLSVQQCALGSASPRCAADVASGLPRLCAWISPECHSSLPAQSADVTLRSRDRASRSGRVSNPVRRVAGSCVEHADEQEPVHHLLGPTLKSRSRFAGGCAVRHRRCPFLFREELAIGSQRFLLSWQKAHLVHPEVQRGSGSNDNWPSKATWRRARAVDRLLKMDALRL